MEKRNETPSSTSRIRYSVVLSICLAVYFVLVLSISIPVLIKNLKKANSKEHFEMYVNTLKNRPETTINAVYYTINGPVTVERTLTTEGRDDYHLVLEGLFLPLSQEEIANGIVSYIPKDTALLGCTEVNGNVFVRLSRDFLNSPALNLAIGQIEQSLKNTGEVIKVNIIVDGVII